MPRLGLLEREGAASEGALPCIRTGSKRVSDGRLLWGVLTVLLETLQDSCPAAAGVAFPQHEAITGVTQGPEIQTLGS